MLNSLGYPEMGMLLLFGMFIFGPDRLPGMAKELGKLLRQARSYGKSVRDDLKTEMGPEFGDLDLRSLSPKTFIRKHLLEDEVTAAGTFTPAADLTVPTAPVPTTPALTAPGVTLGKPATPDPVTTVLPTAPVTPVGSATVVTPVGSATPAGLLTPVTPVDPVTPAAADLPPVFPVPVQPALGQPAAATAPTRTVFRDPSSGNAPV